MRIWQVSVVGLLIGFRLLLESLSGAAIAIGVAIAIASLLIGAV